jgi:hypothetical protein
MTAVADLDPSLAGTLGRAGALLRWHDLQAGRPDGDGWVACTDVLPVLDGWLADVAASCQAPPETAASYWLGWYADGVAAAAIPTFVAERRVPDLAPANLSLHRDDGHWVDASAVHGPALTVLPDDPAAGHPAATVVADVDALRRHLSAALLTHLAPVVEAVRQRVRLGLRVRWGLVADSIAGTFLEVGRGLGDQRAAAAEADAFLAVAAPTLRARPTWVPLEHRGTCHVFLRRSACCLAYKTPDSGYCTSCPSTPAEEREQRLRAWLDEEGE